MALRACTDGRGADIGFYPGTAPHQTSLERLWRSSIVIFMDRAIPKTICAGAQRHLCNLWRNPYIRSHSHYRSSQSGIVSNTVKPSGSTTQSGRSRLNNTMVGLKHDGSSSDPA